MKIQKLKYSNKLATLRNAYEESISEMLNMLYRESHFSGTVLNEHNVIHLHTDNVLILYLRTFC